MKKPEANKPYDFLQATDEKGNDIDHNFMLTLDRPFEDIKAEFTLLVDEIPGVQGIEPVGPYSLSFIIARTFDAQEIREYIAFKLKQIYTGTYKPIVTPPKKKIELVQ